VGKHLYRVPSTDCPLVHRVLLQAFRLFSAWLRIHCVSTTTGPLRLTEEVVILIVAVRFLRHAVLQKGGIRTRVYWRELVSIFSRFVCIVRTVQCEHTYLYARCHGITHVGLPLVRCIIAMLTMNGYRVVAPVSVTFQPQHDTGLLAIEFI